MVQVVFDSSGGAGAWWRWSLVALSAAAALLGAPCATAQTVAQTTAVTTTPDAVTMQALQPAPLKDLAADYALAPGDLLRVQVYQQPDLSMEVRVQDNGQLSYPLIGPLPLAGLTVVQAEKLIESGLRSGQFLRHPQVSISVLQVRGHMVSVLGHVQRPGRFPIEKPGLRLSELLAQAGGVTAVGADSVVLQGMRAGSAFRQQVELAAIFEGRQQQSDPVVENGDVVFVDRAPVVYLVGEVQRPGPVRLERQMTVLQALAASGGPTPRGTLRGLKVTRRGLDGALQSWVPELGAPVQAGDVLQVQESLF